MLVSCWSAKGGSGTTTVVAALGRILAARADDGALLVDLAGDLPAALGAPEPDGPGVADWLAAGPAVPADALARLEVRIGPSLRLLPRGRGALTGPGRADVLAEVLACDVRPVVVDVGTVVADGTGGPAAEVTRLLAGAATHSLLVTRPCFLSLRRALALPLRPSGVVLVVEDGRALGVREVEDVLCVPVVAEVATEPAVARAVDSGMLGARLPRNLERSLRHAA
jgi:MinD-like ATPase involved in chromosome partitioning or flagellar assembly